MTACESWAVSSFKMHVPKQTLQHQLKTLWHKYRPICAAQLTDWQISVIVEKLKTTLNVNMQVI